MDQDALLLDDMPTPIEMLEFSDDLVAADVDPLRAFLRAWLGELVGEAENGHCRTLP